MEGNIIMSIPSITTFIDSFTRTPSRKNPTTFSADMDARLSEENSRITQMNSMSSEMNELAEYVGASSESVSLAAEATKTLANFNGEWSELAYYTHPSTVSHVGSLYASMQSSSGIEPGTDSDYWIELNLFQKLSEKAQPLGYASLDATGKVPSSQLPEIGSGGAETLTEEIVVTVGSGGDYSTINDALAYLSALRPAYANGGIDAKVNLLSGFVMQEPVVVSGIDLGWITIAGDDEVTLMDGPSMDGVLAAFSGSHGATLPTISQVFEVASGIVVVRGVYVSLLARAVVDNGGFIGTDYGVYAFSGGEVTLSYSKLSACKISAINVKGASVYTYESEMSNTPESTYHLLLAWSGAILSVSQSVLRQNSDYFAASPVRAGNGSVVAVYASDIFNESTTPDLNVLVGGTIATTRAYHTTGQTPNTLTGNGIIYQ
jgi:hypothetical protein